MVATLTFESLKLTYPTLTKTSIADAQESKTAEHNGIDQ